MLVDARTQPAASEICGVRIAANPRDDFLIFFDDALSQTCGSFEAPLYRINLHTRRWPFVHWKSSLSNLSLALFPRVLKHPKIDTDFEQLPGTLRRYRRIKPAANFSQRQALPDEHLRFVDACLLML